MLFDLEGGQVHRFNVCTNTALSDFSDQGGDFAMRLLPSGGLLVANEIEVDRMDAAGNVFQIFDATDEDSWFALSLDPDGTSFWSANTLTSNIYRFDIISGARLTNFNSGTDTGTVFGLTVVGEITVSGPDAGAPPSPPSCALTAVIAGPPKQLQITVQDPTDGVHDIEVTESMNANVTLPPFRPGDMTPLVVVATKIDQAQGARVALRITDVNGAVTNCDPVVPGEPPPATHSAAAGGAGCSVGPGQRSGLPGLFGILGLVGLTFLRRRRVTS
jgi:MYXO-CTERM domain-containing protein